MRKLLIIKLIVFTLFLFTLNSGHGQKASDWNRLYNNAKKTVSKFPTVSQINSLSLPSKSKQWLLDTRETLSTIANNKTQPNQQASRQFFSKVESLQKEIQENLVMMLKDNGSGPGSSSNTAEKCSEQYNKCMKELNCSYEYQCTCCASCSVLYLACMLDIIIVSQRTDIKTRAPGTATHN